ncbi:MAG: helix-turn-helix domain-containing protein [Nitriliruptorales bacterium]
MDRERERLGDYLRRRRLELGLSQADAAGIAEISETTWRNVETGRHAPRSSTLDGIAKAVETSRRTLVRLMDDSIADLPSPDPDSREAQSIGTSCAFCQAPVTENGIRWRPVERYIQVRQKESDRNIWSWPIAADDGYVPTLFYCSLECAVRGGAQWLTSMSQHTPGEQIRVEFLSE